jgi:very-short-patch-repair endonuclease
MTEIEAIPCTTAERTLLDLAGIVSVRELRSAVGEAEVRRILDLAEMRSLIGRARGRRGVARLRNVIDDIDQSTRLTRSELERRVLEICRQADLPRPEVNVLLDLGDVRFRPDFLWRGAGLILEADSRRFHDTDLAFDSDRKREQRLMLAGWRVCRCTWAQVERQPHDLARTLAALIAHPQPTGRIP